MVFEAVVDSVADLVLIVGLPMLFVLFFLEGLIIGKLLQPPAVFVTVVAISQPAWSTLAVLSAGCTLAVSAGQWTTYRSFDSDSPEFVGIRARWPLLYQLPEKAVAKIGRKRFRIVESLFDRFGGAGIFITTFLPGVRGLLAVPAGISAYPTRRFLGVTLIGNALYFPALVAVAFGLLQLIGLW